MKSYRFFRGQRLLQHLPNRRKNHLDSRIISLFQGIDFAPQILVTRKYFAQTHKRPHDCNVHLYRTFASRYARKQFISALILFAECRSCWSGPRETLWCDDFESAPRRPAQYRQIPKRFYVSVGKVGLGGFEIAICNGKDWRVWRTSVCAVCLQRAGHSDALPLGRSLWWVVSCAAPIPISNLECQTQP